MAPNRTLLRAVARASSLRVVRVNFASYSTATRSITYSPPTSVTRAFIPRTVALQRRWLSTNPNGETKVYDFEKIKSLIESPSDRTLLLDVREPHEYAEGFIPTALNMPIQSQPDALFLSPEEFEDRFGFAKPPPDKKVIFYCKSGVRSRAAAQLAVQNGYEDVGEYPGSWLDWVKKGGNS